ncbi:DedA family protein [Eubacteriales bacterium OttesenSCG-928-A19]|nr:DedA family protein [Eubacteriales bacterium OttesenSCG-928-A19]
MTAYVQSLLLHIELLPPLMVFIFFFVSGFLQIVFPPYPGDTVLVFGGCLGGLDLTQVGWLALLGYLSATVVSSLLLYELGFRMRDRIFRIPLITKIMPLEKRAHVESQFKRHGVGLLVLCKFIPGVNTLVILLGGVLQYPHTKGMAAIALSSILHNTLFFFVGHLLGRNLDAIELFLRRYTAFAIAVVTVICTGLLLWHIVKKRRENKA